MFSDGVHCEVCGGKKSAAKNKVLKSVSGLFLSISKYTRLSIKMSLPLMFQDSFLREREGCGIVASTTRMAGDPERVASGHGTQQAVLAGEGREGLF